VLIPLAAASYTALALIYPRFSVPFGAAVHDGLHTSLGLGMWLVPLALGLLPAALQDGSGLQRLWVASVAALLIASLGGGLFRDSGWGGVLGDSSASLGYHYLHWGYPLLLAALALFAMARIAGRSLLWPLLRNTYGAVLRTGEAVAEYRTTVETEVAALQEAHRLSAAQHKALVQRREQLRRTRQQHVLAAELEAADAPEGDSPVIRGETPAAVAVPLSTSAPAIRPLPGIAAERQPAEVEASTVLSIASLAEQPFDSTASATEAGRPERKHFTPPAAPAPAVLVEEGLPAGQLVLFPSTQVGYELPPLNLLRDAVAAEGEERYLTQRARTIEQTLASFNIEASCINAIVGPRVTRYELRIGPGINVNRIHALSDNLALELAVKAVRIEAPVPGLSAVGIEVPNASPQLVTLKSVLESPLNQRANHPLTVALGRDIAGQAVIANLAKMPHVLVAGATGSGKSVCLNALIVSLLYRNAPDSLRLILIDPKRVEMTCYADVPHLACPVVHDVQQAQSALKWAVAEMDRRYRLLEAKRTRNIAAYNEQASEAERLPFIVVVIDELADLMMLAGQVIEKLVCRIAQLSRAVGIHLVIATQRPDVKVITGTIKANIPSRVAFAVVSQIDSRTILDSGGADKLLGSGDMLFSPIGENMPLRVQGCFLADDEIDRVVGWCRGQAQAAYDESITMLTLDDGEAGGGTGGDGRDELFAEACEIVQASSRASTSYLQRRLKIGYNRAARIMEELEEAGVVSAPDAQGNRKVL
jgi:DNA segregation ATPase FtsK/SpoIIIE-like protein